MAELTKEQLIELITREVLKTLGGGEADEPVDKSGLPRALCIGPADQLPKTVRAQYDLRPMEEYQGDIEPFEKVFITAITQTQLAVVIPAPAVHLACFSPRQHVLGITFSFMFQSTSFSTQDLLPPVSRLILSCCVNVSTWNYFF